MPECAQSKSTSPASNGPSRIVAPSTHAPAVFVIETGDLQLARQAFASALSHGTNLWIAGARHMGKSVILDRLMREQIGQVSVVYQAGVPPILRNEVGSDIANELSYTFDPSQRVMLFLDEFDGEIELTRLINQIHSFNYTLIIASNHSRTPAALEPCHFLRLRGLTLEESASVARAVANQVRSAGASVHDMDNFLKWATQPSILQELLAQCGGRTGAFVLLVGKLFALGPSYTPHAPRQDLANETGSLLCSPTACTVRKIFKVTGPGLIKASQSTIFWG